MINVLSGHISSLICQAPRVTDNRSIGNMFFNYRKNRAWTENLSIVMQLGLTMAGCICFCFFIGLMLDRWLNIRGIFVTVFIVLGVIGGANVAYRQIMEIFDQKDKGPKSADHGTD